MTDGRENVPHLQCGSWEIGQLPILVFPAEITRKRELCTEASFILFFSIGCLRWREAGGDGLLME